MKFYAIAENCFVRGRFDSQDDSNLNDPEEEPVVMRNRGIFKKYNQAEKIAKKLNKEKKTDSWESVDGYNDDAFVVVELELNSK